MYLLEKNFDNATKEDLEELKLYFKGCDYRSSGHTYSSLYMWGPQYNTSWQVINGYLWTISSYLDEKSEEKHYSTMPLSLDGKYDTERLKSSMVYIKEKLEGRGHKGILYQVPNHMVEILRKAWDGPIKIVEDRDSFDYVYEKDKLINLSGRALHKKKNHLNFFLNHYDYEAGPLEEDQIQEAISFIRNFNEEKETGSEYEANVLLRETEAIERSLEYNVYKPGYYTMAIWIEGKIVALSIGAPLSKDTVVAHTEKASYDYHGLYQVINMEFCKALPKTIKYVNREEDMGIENLRQSKESYQPYEMWEKSTVII